MSGGKDRAINKNTLLLGNKDNNICVQKKQENNCILISKKSKITRKHKQFYSSMLLLSCCVVSMTGDGKGKKKGTDIFYVFHNGKPLNSGFGDLIEKWSLP